MLGSKACSVKQTLDLCVFLVVGGCSEFLLGTSSNSLGCSYCGISGFHLFSYRVSWRHVEVGERDASLDYGMVTICNHRCCTDF